MLRAFRGAFRMELQTMRAYPDALIPLMMAPLFSIIFLAILRHADRGDLTGYAVMAPVLISLWWLALFQSGGIIQSDRWLGTIEPVVAAPTPLAVVVGGRVAAVTLVGLVSFGEVWLVTWAVFGERVGIHHPARFVLTLAVTALAMAGTALVMAALFVLSRTSATFQNSASYPFYVLGGVLVPVSFLPGWIQPLSKAVFLSWSADLLRSTLGAGPVHHFAFRIAMILLLGACGYGLGWTMVERFLHRVRASGDLGLA
jgi:ABC-2 type transport system permease protein